MGKLTELKNVEDIVRDILMDFPAARNSDDVLYFMVCKSINAISINLPFGDIVLNRKRHGFPAYASVARAGRNVRRLHPELSGKDDVEGHRKENEAAFKEFAKV